MSLWFHQRFSEVYERAVGVREKCPSGDFGGGAQYLDRHIFDKALELARAAALDELENNQGNASWNSSKCILAYETAASLLAGLLDPGDENLALSTNSISTVEKFLKSIHKRLGALQGGAAVASTPLVSPVV